MSYPRFPIWAAAVAALALLVAACEPKSAAVPVPPSVSASTPVERVVTGWDTFTGRLDAVDTVEVRPRVSGYVQTVAFRDGDYVHRGDLLFIVDPRPYQAAVAQAAGQLAQARAQLAFANKELDRAKSLVGTHAIAVSVLDERQQNQQAAAAAVLGATGTLERAELDLEFTRIVAPIDGRISRKLVGEGNLVAGGDAGATLLTTIVSLDTIDVYFDIDEESYLRYGQLVRDGRRGAAIDLGSKVMVALPGETSPSFSGTLDFSDNRLDVSTGTLRVRARIQNLDHTLNPGQFVRVSMVADPPHTAMLVPASAITSDAARQILYVVGADNQIVARPVVLGRLFGKLREVTQGLQPADRVVVSGIQRAQPGIKVIVETETIDPKQFASAGAVL
jgi:multidrug efflux system membrane fusion protein